MYGNEGGFRNFAPVNVGDEVDVKIEAVGEKGDGIAKIKGFVIFVPNVKEGDDVKVRITKVLRKVGFGEVVGEGSAEASEESQDEQSEGTEEQQEASEEAPQEETNEEQAEEAPVEEATDTEDFGEEDQEQK
ncbi:hypothetical protein CL617_04090 [archaeon]|nr:hypothetical protein [archaeon]